MIGRRLGFTCFVGCLALSTTTHGPLASEFVGDDVPKPAASSQKPEADDAPLADLANRMLKKGMSMPIIPGLAAFLDIPSGPGNSTMRQGFIRGEGGDARMISVRRRSASDRVDIILMSKVGSRETYYLTSPSGVLEKGAVKIDADSPPRHLNNKEKKGFEAEVAFWKDWFSKLPKPDPKKQRSKTPAASRPTKKPAEETP